MDDKDPDEKFLNYAGPDSEEPGNPDLKKLPSYFLIYGAPVLILSFLGANFAMNLELFWIFFFATGVITAFLGAMNARQTKYKATFLLISVFLFLPPCLIPWIAYASHQKFNLHSTRITRLVLNQLSREIDADIAEEKNMDPRRQRPPRTIIADVLKDRAQHDYGWDRPFQFVYPGVHNPNGYDLFSAGPDGIYGNADDIGNW